MRGQKGSVRSQPGDGFMNIAINTQEHLVRVSLRGPCTICEAAELRRALSPLSGETTAIMVELDGITELDSAGLQALLSLRQDCSTVLFCYANGVVARTVEQLDMHQQFYQDH